MSKGHFNGGHIWGRITDLTLRKTERNERPYADLKVLCPSDEYGQVMAHARMFGDKEIDELARAYKDNPEMRYHFTGILTQYEKDGHTYTGYKVFKAELTQAVPRAAFILSGRCVGKDYDRLPVMLKVEVALKGSGGREERTILRAAITDEMEKAVHMDDHVRAKGVLMDRDAEWGGGGVVEPTVQEIEVNNMRIRRV